MSVGDKIVLELAKVIHGLDIISYELKERYGGLLSRWRSLVFYYIIIHGIFT